ncbi:high light inducible protein [Kovacikia minuta CCNUW1]|uniref:chlorophyll a/b-binding protein n=1 Tax=Kovacikia minuta TaxID=2931930 RepID=UPI001CCDDD82|nr:chlorophyll a/b-binding protein [Kovacikia minuta]UBF25653.1 high light inducible protein [Kovacikia minuta CCNUW1]
MTDTTKVTAPVVETDRNAWKFGFTPQAEIWNGRLAMIGFLSAILIELFSGQGLLQFWGLL